MKNDEFAFFNQQLAAMVRDGIPLETALRRLCADMRRGSLRAELERLEADLAKGTPLREAVRARQLPELYRQMLEVGAASKDLPGILTLLADHYQRQHVVATRLKGLMVYPTLVLIGCFVLACFMTVLAFSVKRAMNLSQSLDWMQPVSFIGVWLAPIGFAVVIVILLTALSSSRLRRLLRWKLPAFKEASLAQLASSLAVMLKSGVPLNNALALMEQLEHGTLAEKELARWRQRLADGHGQFSEMTAVGTLFPPLFLWTVAQSRDDLAGGFERAADTYRSRASYRTDLLLYSALPCSIFLLALVIMWEIQPIIGFFVALFRPLNALD